MESSVLRSELEEVDSQLACLEQELDSLLQRQQELQERRQLLQAQLESIEDVQEERSKLEATDWERGVFPWSEEARSTLSAFFKLESFRPLQLSCINATLAKKDVVLIMPTGGGKSLCYQLPAVLSSGIALVISPLVSLMQDQLLAVKNLGIESSMLNADSTQAEVRRVHDSMTDKRGSLKLLYVTPEKIAKSKRFMAKLEKCYETGRLSRIVIDEVHCASQWGHDFRPDFKILGILKRQFPNAPILGLTATASSKVLADVKEILSLKQCLIFRASYNRSNLFYEVRSKPTSHKAQVEELARFIRTKFPRQSGIVYCFTRKDTEQVALDLSQLGVKAGCYHAHLPSSDRTRVHMQWLKNDIQVIVATVAFGMGIDKPNVRFVLHHSISKSMENYYQESGRAGRDGAPASCVIYYRAADVFKQSTMVFTEHTGLQNLYSMLRYCLNGAECRRALIARSFGEKWRASDCQAACDVCRSGRRVSLEDISECCAALIDIVEHAGAREERLTGLKVVDVWKSKHKKGSSGGNPSTREDCELALMHGILEGVLKEEFHFTPYSTISYVGLGRKATAVKKGMLRVKIRTTERGTERAGEQVSSKKAALNNPTSSSDSRHAAHTPTNTSKARRLGLKPSEKGKGKSVCSPSEAKGTGEGTVDHSLGISGRGEVSDSPRDGHDFRKRPRGREFPSDESSSDEDFVPTPKKRSHETRPHVGGRNPQHTDQVIELDSD